MSHFDNVLAHDFISQPLKQNPPKHRMPSQDLWRTGVRRNSQETFQIGYEARCD